ncbi:MAG TPA: CAP domain-containing protein [Solirubrobacteraceae bacterium]|nr:CAP domain-containing protein [Solirubrobacteraceae bacterium]
MLRRSTTLRSAAGILLMTVIVSAPAEAADCRGLADAEAVICEVNDVRAGHGLEKLGKDRRLQRAAAAHARDMVQRGYFSHLTPEGEKLSDRLRDTGYITGRVTWRVGETLAWGRNASSAPAATVTAWMRSASHRRILLGHYREIGVGVVDGVPAGGGGSTYAADFGLLAG